MSQFVEFENKTENPMIPGVFDILPEELLKEKDNICLIDVRSEAEFVGELGHVKDSELMLLDNLPENIENLPKDKSIVFICRSGNRSAQASHFAKSKGYKNTYNLKGGMLFWNEKGLEISK